MLTKKGHLCCPVLYCLTIMLLFILRKEVVRTFYIFALNLNSNPDLLMLFDLIILLLFIFYSVC